MKRVFADTLFWVATISPDDPWHTHSLRAVAALGKFQFVTTQEVLVEVLSAYAGRGHLRHTAARTVRSLLVNADVIVLPQSEQSFTEGLALYESRADKGYSLVDCISMNAMRSAGITDILTNDHHFLQEGFHLLIQRE